MRKTFCHPFVGRGRATLAINSTDDTLVVGIAWCSPRDQFSRAKGRKIATDRLNTHKKEHATEKAFYFSANRNTELRPDEQARTILTELVNARKVPRWATRKPIQDQDNQPITLH